jgi:hypothetical protein
MNHPAVSVGASQAIGWFLLECVHCISLGVIDVVAG